jgi:hypothetical protein
MKLEQFEGKTFSYRSRDFSKEMEMLKLMNMQAIKWLKE